MLSFHRNLQALSLQGSKLLQICIQIQDINQSLLTQLIPKLDANQKGYLTHLQLQQICYTNDSTQNETINKYIHHQLPQKCPYLVLSNFIYKNVKILLESSHIFYSKQQKVKVELGISQIKALIRNYMLSICSLSSLKLEIINVIGKYIYSGLNSEIDFHTFSEYIRKQTLKVDYKLVYSFLADQQEKKIFVDSHIINRMPPKSQFPTQAVHNINDIMQRLQAQIHNFGQQWLISQQLFGSSL